MILEPFDSPLRPNESAKAVGGAPKKAIVFVHGILSNPETFSDFRKELIQQRLCVGWNLFALRYDWDRSILTNGRECAFTLANCFSNDDQVALVCHSMGGLLARVAVLSAKLPFLKTIFLIGTPNQGTFVNAQLGLLLQLLRAATGKLTTLNHRQRGLYDLTRVPRLLRDCGTIENSNHVDYISLPGLYFNRSRELGDIMEVLRKDKAIAGLTLVRSMIGYSLSKRGTRVRSYKPRCR